MFDNNKLGEIRPNQLITTFGPGSIVDAVKDSVTVLDLNYWKEKGKKIIDGRLASYLGVDCFYMPRTSYSGDIPVVSFPYMHVCSNVKCGRIFDLRENFDLDRYLKFGVTCPECLNNVPAGNNSNGAACHSCCMISETACENGNRMLDRGLIVPIDGRENQSYFKTLVEELCQLEV